MNCLRITVLSLWTVGLAALLAAGRYSLFIRAALWPLLLGTLLMFVLLLLAMYFRRGGASRPASAAVWARSCLLLLPLAYMVPMVFGSAASGLNSFALQKRSLGLDTGASLAGGSNDAPPAATADKTVSIAMVARYFRRLEGKPVVTEGRVYHDESMPAGEMGMYRFVVVCCAADAMPVQLLVRSPNLASFKGDDWVRVSGVVHSAEYNGSRSAVIDATDVQKIAPPDEPYLSPSGW